MQVFDCLRVLVREGIVKQTGDDGSFADLSGSQNYQPEAEGVTGTSRRRHLLRKSVGIKYPERAQINEALFAQI